MGKVLMPCGSGGVTSDELTAVANDVIKGKTAVTNDSDDEIIVGTLELTGTATPDKVLLGESFYNVDAQTIELGTMTNRGAWTSTPTASGNVTIPAGYHNGSGYVNTATVYNNGVSSGKTTGLKSVTLVDTTGFFSAGTSGTRWSWTNNLGACKVLIYINVSKSNWDGSSNVTVYRDSTKLFSQDIYSTYEHGHTLAKGQTLKINADNTNTFVKDCLIVLYGFS